MCQLDHIADVGKSFLRQGRGRQGGGRQGERRQGGRRQDGGILLSVRVGRILLIRAGWWKSANPGGLVDIC